MASPYYRGRSTPATPGTTFSPLSQGTPATYSTFAAPNEEQDMYGYKTPWTPVSPGQASECGATVASSDQRQAHAPPAPRALPTPRTTPTSLTRARSQTPGFPMTPAAPTPTRPQTPGGFPMTPAPSSAPAPALTPQQMENMWMNNPLNPKAWELKNIKCYDSQCSADGSGFDCGDEDGFASHMYIVHGTGFLPGYGVHPGWSAGF